MYLKTIAAASIALFLDSVALAAVPAWEKGALQALYYQTEGDSWSRNSNWLTGDPCLNNWEGVFCNSLKNHVVRLNLAGFGLSGSLPSEIGDLTMLEMADLSFNALSGGLPKEIGQLSNLQYLMLEGNQLSGLIPREMGQLVLLRELNLKGNQLTGAIPPELGNLTQLDTLNLAQNQLTGYIPSEFSRLTRLRNLYLWGNQLTGPIPGDVFSALTNLEVLYLNNNDFVGEIPAELGSLPKLEELSLANNHLTGEIPDELGNLSTLKWLFLNSNALTGALPDSLSQLNLDVYSFRFNALYTDNPSLAAFLDPNTQTLPPSNVSIDSVTTHSFSLSWAAGSAPDNVDNGYLVYYGESEGNHQFHGLRINDVATTTGVLDGLLMNQRYCVVVHTWSAASEAWNDNEVLSMASEEVCATVAGGDPDVDGDGLSDLVDKDLCNVESPLMMVTTSYYGGGDTRLGDAERIEFVADNTVALLAPHLMVLEAPEVSFQSGSVFSVERGGILRITSGSEVCLNN